MNLDELTIISGGQTGADVGALKAAKAAGIKTGGTMPKGFRTLVGNKPEYAELFGMKEHHSVGYKDRTFKNVRDADGTIRIAYNFNTPGEICTFNAIQYFGKKSFSVKVSGMCYLPNAPISYPKLAAKWIIKNGIKILNVAGNSEETFSGMEKWVIYFMFDLFDELETL